MSKKNHEPLTVVVTDTRWDALGPRTIRSTFLYALLRQQGGINESVQPGTYNYDIKREGFKFIVSLTEA